MTIKSFVYSVYDRKALYYLPPFVARSDAEAMRSFIEAVKATDTPMSLYPLDFDLVRCGTFDLDTGVLEGSGCYVLINGLSALEAAHAERARYASSFQAPQQEVRFDEALDQSSPSSLSS